MRQLLILACAVLLLAGCRTTPAAAGAGGGGGGGALMGSGGDLAAPVTLPARGDLARGDLARVDLTRVDLTQKGAGCCEPCKLGCWDPPPCRNTYLDSMLSFLPNIGVGVGAGRIVRSTTSQDFSLEVAGIYQFVDDETFADDGNPAAGDWVQVRAGLKTSSSPRARRHFTKRIGVVWFDAQGEPNIIDRPGTYWGLYGGVGYETDLSSSLSVGPELSLMVVSETDHFEIARPIPQLNWHVVWWPGGRGKCIRRTPYGELYAGVAALVSPGLGGAVEFGQVFSRSALATWSFEMQAGFESPSDALAFESDGKWAQIRGGLKASFQPCGCGHWTARAGVAWLRSTAQNEFLDTTGDFVGGYLGAGYEWDLGRRFTTGPELSVLFMTEEKHFDVQLVPQFSWHFILNL